MMCTDSVDFFVDHVVLKQCLFLIFFSVYLIFHVAPSTKSFTQLRKVLHGLKRQQKTNKSKGSQDFSIYFLINGYRFAHRQSKFFFNYYLW